MTALQTLNLEGRTTNDQASPSWLRESGMSRAGRQHRDQAARRRWDAHIVEALRLYERVLTGDRYAAAQFSEAMTTSDFPLLFADVLDRQLMAAYQEWPSAWQGIAKRGSVRDFRTVKRFDIAGGTGVLERVEQRSEYPEAGLTEAKYEYSVAKYGRRLSIDWEMLIDDDLDAFRELPQRLGKAARMTEDKFATNLFVDSTGPDGTFFAAGHGNIVTGNPQLSIPGLQTAMTVLNSHVDTDGNPIYIDAVVLMVPPALEITGQNILNAVEIIAATGGGSGQGSDQLRSRNWMSNRVRLAVNPWLPLVDTTSGNTAWYLFADPNNGRPAMEVGFLRGAENPSLWVKAPNALRVGGGMAPETDGDFEADGIQHKVRHVLGGTLMDPYMAVASTGALDVTS